MRSSKNTLNDNINRIIDANINRAKEGLRVCEEITRFVLENKPLTAKCKALRHAMDGLIRNSGFAGKLIQTRYALQDIGQHIYANELKRKGLADIFFANIQRVKESIRVLEEFAKLTSGASAVKFKNIRYEIYELEKKITQKVLSLHNRR